MVEYRTKPPQVASNDAPHQRGHVVLISGVDVGLASRFSLPKRTDWWFLWVFHQPQNNTYSNIIWLVVEPPLWKIWKTVGMMKFPIYGKYIINVPVTTNQLYSTLAVSRSNWNRVFLKLGMAIPWGRSFRCVSRLSAILDYIQIFRIQMT